MRRPALLVLACPRSGASALVAALARDGASVGRTLAASAARASAPLQLPAVAALNERLLAALGMRWDSLVPPPERWAEHAAVRALAGAADALIAEEFAGAQRVVFHEARLALTASFWRERFEAADFDVGCAIVVRRPAAVAASMARGEPFAPEKSLALWLHHLLAAERGSRGAPRALVAYEQLLTAPAAQLAQIARSARFDFGEPPGEPLAAAAAIRRELCRCEDGGDRSVARLSSGIDRVLDEGYRQLAALASTADPRRAIEAVGVAAQPALALAIPPWLAHELGVARTRAERAAEALREAQAQRDEHAAMLHKRADDPPVLPAADLNARVDEALREIRQDMARVNATLADQRERERVLAIENAQLQRDLVDERNTIAKLSDAIELERRTSEQLAAELAHAHASVQALEAEIDHARAIERSWNEHVAALARERDDARDRHDIVALERDALRRDRDDAARRCETLRAELDAVRADLRIVDNDRTALAARAQAVGDAASGLREELARRSASEAARAAERDRIAEELRKQTARAENLERELERRMHDLTNLSGRHESLGKTLAAVEKTWLGKRALDSVRRGGD